MPVQLGTPQTFRCDRLHATLSVNACASRFKLANAGKARPGRKAMARADLAASPCHQCPVGKLHASGATTPRELRAAIGATCARHATRPSLPGRVLCAKCIAYDEARRRARGVKPKAVLLTWEGLTLPLTAWARRVGIGPGRLSWRRSKGWSVERMLTERTKIGRRTQGQCKRGHESAAVGRSSSGGCLACMRESYQRTRQARKCNGCGAPAVASRCEPCAEFAAASARARRRVMQGQVAQLARAAPAGVGSAA